MKTLVINLSHRRDRLDKFKQNNADFISYDVLKAVDGYKVEYKDLRKMGFDTDHDWIDPILNTPLTKGEIGCFLSHWKAWKQCIKANEPILVLEDDAIITDEFSYDELYKLRRQGYNFVYLGWKEMEESVPIDDKFVKPVYPYWGLAYVITPESAKILTKGKPKIIPVDEYLPRMIEKLNVVAYKENVIVPRDRKDGGSNINPTSRYDYFVDFETHVCTVATDESRANKLIHSANQFDVNLNNLGKGVKWEGGTMEGQGGGHKINLVKEFLKDKKDHDIILFLDGYDTFLTDYTDEIISRYIEFSHSIVFSSERFCWPDERYGSKLKALNSDQSTPYQYLNSGMYIGRVDELKKLFAEPLKNSDDDQLYVQEQYLKGECDLVCDIEGYIFNTHEPQISKRNGQLYNPVTQCYSCAYHGNGGEDAKIVLNSIYERFFGNPVITYTQTKKYDILSDDILLIDFMSKDMCEKMISLSEKHTFSSLSYDKVKGQELRLKEFGMWDELEEHWNTHVYPIVHEFWTPCHMWGMRDAFLIKYEMEKQRDLPLHNDASLVTGSVKLNDDYEGGVLEFPRQSFSNKDIPIGKCILFPGQVTHGHLSTSLTKGTKYSLTIWSQRYSGDSI
tara:strand:- start:1055 stop:2914 length:1860 start_codon:yes stop_codon:yes gene_type:complete